MAKMRTSLGLLILTAALTGIFTGLRGSTFIVIGGRFGARLRILLFESLLQQAHATPSHHHHPPTSTTTTITHSAGARHHITSHHITSHHITLSIPQELDIT
jgi:hypothetical protein